MPALSPAGLAKVEHYLLPTERAVITVRRHWAVVVEPVASAVAALIVAAVLAVQLPAELALLRPLLWLGFAAVAARMMWYLLLRQKDWFVVTDERLLLTYGVITHRVAIMPLTKVTDMSYNVSLFGRVLRYGEFVFESAGQDQALRTVNFLPDSQNLFTVLSNELFGPEGVASTRGRRKT